jgi:integrase
LRGQITAGYLLDYSEGYLMDKKLKEKLNARNVNALKSAAKRYRVFDTEIMGFHVRISPKGKKTYALAYRHNGLAREFTLNVKKGHATADQARALAKIYVGMIASGEDIQATKQAAHAKAKAEKHQTLGAFVKAKYQPWAERELRSAKESMRTLSRDFGYLYSRKLNDITPWIIESWSKQAKRKGLLPTTINRRVAILKSVLSKAALWGVIEHSPLKGMSHLKTDKTGRVRYLTDDEEKQLRSALEARQERCRKGRISHNRWLNDRQRATLPILSASFTDYLMPMVILALNTGMRRGELFSLIWSDIDLKNKQLTVQGHSSKSGNTRYLPLNDEACSTLTVWRNQNTGKDLVFPSLITGQRLDNIRKSWAGLRKLADLQDFRFHDLRHSFASKLVMAGVDLNTVRELLGHASMEMTLRYAHLAPQHKAAAVALLNQ